MDKQKNKTKKPLSLSACAKDVIQDAYVEASRGYPLEKWSMQYKHFDKEKKLIEQNLQVFEAKKNSWSQSKNSFNPEYHMIN